MLDEVRNAAADAGLDARVFNPEVAAADQTFKALVFDATGITSTERAARGVRVLPPDDPPGAPVAAA